MSLRPNGHMQQPNTLPIDIQSIFWRFWRLINMVIMMTI